MKIREKGKEGKEGKEGKRKWFNNREGIEKWLDGRKLQRRSRERRGKNG